jgi:hypothetical protein
LIAVCDDNVLRDRIIAKYECELNSKILPYRLDLLENPSLEKILAKLTLENTYLQRKSQAVFTVINLDKLNTNSQKSQPSEQDIFFGYLQWEREMLKNFPYPIVIWVDTQLLEKLTKNSPDFWSWRKGVFRFFVEKNDTDRVSIDSLTWQLCGKYEAAQSQLEYVVGQNAGGSLQTNYAEHVDDVLYR